MVINQKRYHLITYHGTILSFDKKNRILCHRPIPDRNFQFHHFSIILDAELYSATDLMGKSLSDFEQDIQTDTKSLNPIFCPGLSIGLISLKQDAAFWTAEPDFKLTYKTEACNLWENFFVIPSRDLDKLLYLKLNSWFLKQENLIVEKIQIHFCENFTFQIASHQFQLKNILPIDDCISDDYFKLLISSSNNFFVDGSRIASFRTTQVPDKKIWIKPLGNMGNRVLQYLVADKIHRLTPNSTVENIHLPEWGLESKHLKPNPATSAATGEFQYWIDVPGLADGLRKDIVDTIILDGYPFNLDHYPSREISKTLLGPTVEGKEAIGFSSHELVCSIRAGEILSGFHEHYIVLPPGYYRLLAELSGLELVFYGQLGDDPYSESLRLAFPNSKFVLGRNPQYDFDVLRKSENIACSISTFSWLSAWLSDAKKIFLPVGGLFSPIQNPYQMYLPIYDPAYEFVLLPFSKAINLWSEPDKFKIEQDFLASNAQLVGRFELEQICRRAKDIYRHRPLLGGFDPEFYLAANPGAISEICNGKQSALEHYLRTGYVSNRPFTEIDDFYYLHKYPDTAMEIANGTFLDPLHHYMATGSSKGYKPYQS